MNDSGSGTKSVDLQALAKELLNVNKATNTTRALVGDVNKLTPEEIDAFDAFIENQPRQWDNNQRAAYATQLNKWKPVGAFLKRNPGLANLMIQKQAKKTKAEIEADRKEKIKFLKTHIKNLNDAIEKTTDAKDRRSLGDELTESTKELSEIEGTSSKTSKLSKPKKTQAKKETPKPKQVKAKKETPKPKKEATPAAPKKPATGKKIFKLDVNELMEGLGGESEEPDTNKTPVETPKEQPKTVTGSVENKTESQQDDEDDNTSGDSTVDKEQGYEKDEEKKKTVDQRRALINLSSLSSKINKIVGPEGTNSFISEAHIKLINAGKALKQARETDSKDKQKIAQQRLNDLQNNIYEALHSNANILSDLEVGNLVFNNMTEASTNSRSSQDAETYYKHVPPTMKGSFSVKRMDEKSDSGNTMRGYLFDSDKTSPNEGGFNLKTFSIRHEKDEIIAPNKVASAVANTLVSVPLVAVSQINQKFAKSEIPKSIRGRTDYQMRTSWRTASEKLHTITNTLPKGSQELADKLLPEEIKELTDHFGQVLTTLDGKEDSKKVLERMYQKISNMAKREGTNLGKLLTESTSGSEDPASRAWAAGEFMKSLFELANENGGYGKNSLVDKASALYEENLYNSKDFKPSGALVKNLNDIESIIQNYRNHGYPVDDVESKRTYLRRLAGNPGAITEFNDAMEDERTNIRDLGLDRDPNNPNDKTNQARQRKIDRLKKDSTTYREGMFQGTGPDPDLMDEIDGVTDKELNEIIKRHETQKMKPYRDVYAPNLFALEQMFGSIEDIPNSVLDVKDIESKGTKRFAKEIEDLQKRKLMYNEDPELFQNMGKWYDLSVDSMKGAKKIDDDAKKARLKAIPQSLKHIDDKFRNLKYSEQDVANWKQNPMAAEDFLHEFVASHAHARRQVQELDEDHPLRIHYEHQHRNLNERAIKGIKTIFRNHGIDYSKIRDDEEKYGINYGKPEHEEDRWNERRQTSPDVQELENIMESDILDDALGGDEGSVFYEQDPDTGKFVPKKFDYDPETGKLTEDIHKPNDEYDVDIPHIYGLSKKDRDKLESLPDYWRALENDDFGSDSTIGRALGKIDRARVESLVRNLEQELKFKVPPKHMERIKETSLKTNKDRYSDVLDSLNNNLKSQGGFTSPDHKQNMIVIQGPDGNFMIANKNKMKEYMQDSHSSSSPWAVSGMRKAANNRRAPWLWRLDGSPMLDHKAVISGNRMYHVPAEEEVLNMRTGVTRGQLRNRAAGNVYNSLAKQGKERLTNDGDFSLPDNNDGKQFYTRSVGKKPEKQTGNAAGNVPATVSGGSAFKPKMPNMKNLGNKALTGTGKALGKVQSMVQFEDQDYVSNPYYTQMEVLS